MTKWFTTTKQAQVVINHWLRQYNHIRPHQDLNMRPTVPETLVKNGTELGVRHSLQRTPFKLFVGRDVFIEGSDFIPRRSW
ncbi:MAG: integrase core domain-containing protein [Alphaproteobacteria bacterium]